MTNAAVSLPRLFNFAGGGSGPWAVTGMRTLAGEALPGTPRVSVAAADAAPGLPSLQIVPGVPMPQGVAWALRGITSNERYVQRQEKAQLLRTQAGLGRAGATHAALIPLRKSPAWWALTQDERRDIFESQSHHIAIGMRYLPAVARRLHHCRDLGPDEPFDFLTWFDYAPADERAFDDLLGALRSAPEWTYVDREIDIRLVRDGG